MVEKYGSKILGGGPSNQWDSYISGRVRSILDIEFLVSGFVLSLPSSLIISARLRSDITRNETRLKTFINIRNLKSWNRKTRSPLGAWIGRQIHQVCSYNFPMESHNVQGSLHLQRVVNEMDKLHRVRGLRLLLCRERGWNKDREATSIYCRNDFHNGRW